LNIISLLNTREVKLTGPFPPGQVMLERLTAREAVGQPFEFELDVLSALPVIDYEAVLGHPVTVELATGDAQWRYFNGYVERLAQAGRAGDATRFRLSLRPWLWLLRHRTNSRIFQDKTAVEVIEQIFGEHGFPFEKKLSGSYKKWEYLVQYRESDFNFVSRLMEQEGLYYFFAHDAQKHTLILADPPNTLPPLDGYAEVPLYPATGNGQHRKRDHLDGWSHSWSVVPGAYSSKDFDFKNPKGDLQVVLQAPKPHPYSQFEVYDHPGEYLQRADGEEHVRKQLELHQAPHALVQASGNARGMTAGSVFRVLDFDFGGAADVKKKYMILETSYDVVANSYTSGGGAGGQMDCSCSLLALDAQVSFRTPTRTPKPVVSGPQTATVVGKDKEEIWTDKYGRVKVQFHWDREGKMDENSSCWVRVSQAWAGGGWGAIHIPRIGQEVIIDFLEGDPDRPIITGRVYNGDNMPPYDLPAHQTRSGIKSRSSQGGTADNANEIRFEDKKGAEELYLQAERDQKTLVKNDQGITVKKDRTVTVGGNETISVSGTRTTTVTKKDTVTLQDEHELTVTKKVKETFNAEHELSVVGPQKIKVDKDKTEHVVLAYELTTDKKFNLQQGGTKLTFEGNKVALDAASVITITRGPAKMSIDDGGKVVISTPTGIAFECGGNKISITPSGVEISAMNVQVKAAQSSVQVSPEGVHTNGSMVNVTATGICSIKGLGTLKLNS
jgi:type VI secretion system secreted protein VgrG